MKGTCKFGNDCSFPHRKSDKPSTSNKDKPTIPSAGLALGLSAIAYPQAKPIAGGDPCAQNAGEETLAHPPVIPNAGGDPSAKIAGEELSVHRPVTLNAGATLVRRIMQGTTLADKSGSPAECVKRPEGKKVERNLKDAVRHGLVIYRLVPRTRSESDSSGFRSK